MSTASRPKRPGVGRAARLLAASFVAAPPCAICGREHAQSGWHLDPMGGMHGRCAGCTDMQASAATMPKAPSPPAN